MKPIGAGKGRKHFYAKIQPFTALCHMGENEDVDFIVGGALAFSTDLKAVECIELVDKTMKEPSKEGSKAGKKEKKVSKVELGGVIKTQQKVR